MTLPDLAKRGAMHEGPDGDDGIAITVFCKSVQDAFAPLYASTGQWRRVHLLQHPPSQATGLQVDLLLCLAGNACGLNVFRSA